MSLVETALLIKCWAFSLRNSYGKSAFLYFTLIFYLFLLHPWKESLFLFHVHIFPHSSIIQHSLKFFSLQFKVAPTFSCVCPPHFLSVCSVGTTAERCSTVDVGRDSYPPWLPLQTLPSLMIEILDKLQMLEVHIRLALIIYLFAMYYVKFYASEEMKSSLQKLHQTKKKLWNYKTQTTHTTHYLLKLLFINRRGANASVKKTGSGFTVTKQLLRAIKTEKSF